MKWMISMTSWIIVIIGTGNVIHLIIEIIFSPIISEGKESYVFVVERITLYSDGVERYVIVFMSD
jgi:hypothetical protein